ncbi:RNA polymerase factor sigma-32 [Wolbachia endosymbiont of Chironomus riparius]|uniref:RNA polymerase factor sigma-32 n=1 Tax=Wolbachia endosymbiont of Chironomus riparius TaxID=2883238 RepID=UPI0020A039DB|nr:RNA polymerase factor sigma-32 [Wolbachia endosymbiont of Chironomus riparius]
MLTSIHINNNSSLTQYIASLKSFPILSHEEEIQLAKNWCEHKDLSSAHKLITSHLNMVVKIAMKFKNYGLSLMDLIMEGNIGLMNAVKKFNPDLGFRFSTYAVWWVKASMKDFILRSWSFIKIGTTQAQRKLFFSLRKIKKRILQYSNRELLNNDEVKAISNELSVSEEDIMQMSNRLIYKDLSLNERISNDSTTELQDIIPHNSLNQELIYQKNEEREIREIMLKNALANLNERARDIFISKYLSEEPKTLEELSKKYLVSRERIRQIAEQAMTKVRQYIESQSSRLKLNA